ncbi:hypothetical protein D3C75_613130 [compost metagenome]
MKVWFYNAHRAVLPELIAKFDNIVFLGKTHGLLKNIKEEDKFICFWNDEETLNVLKQLQNEVFPSKEIIFNFAEGREKMTRFVEQYSKFSIKRDYVNVVGTAEVMVPKLPNSLKVVAKVGGDHKGDNKFCLYPGQKLMVKDSVIFEEFIENGQSIRILLIGNKPYVVEYYDDPDNPRMPENDWIKNINPIIKVRKDVSGYEDLIEDTINMSKIMNYDYLAVDYVRNKDKTAALELNIYPGLTEDEEVRNEAKKYWINKVNELIEP